MTCGTFNDAGFIKELLMIAILLISPAYKDVTFACFFNCLMTGRMNFEQNVKLVNTCFIYDVMHILILQPTVHVLLQIFIKTLNVCSCYKNVIKKSRNGKYNYNSSVY